MRPCVPATAFFCVLAACTGTKPGWKAIAMDTVSEPHKLQMQKAQAARDALAKELLTTLTQEIAARGPAGAISVCREAAPRLAIAISTREGVQIGRTSDRLRNPSNVAPDWAAPALQTKPGQPTYLQGPEGQLGALFPIRIQENCLVCHGAANAIAPEVKAQLAALYTGDSATGYAVGDLRGWFWVAVPVSR